MVWCGDGSSVVWCDMVWCDDTCGDRCGEKCVKSDVDVGERWMSFMIYIIVMGLMIGACLIRDTGFR